MDQGRISKISAAQRILSCGLILLPLSEDHLSQGHKKKQASVQICGVGTWTCSYSASKQMTGLSLDQPPNFKLLGSSGRSCIIKIKQSGCERAKKVSQWVNHLVCKCEGLNSEPCGGIHL